MTTASASTDRVYEGGELFAPFGCSSDPAVRHQNGDGPGNRKASMRRRHKRNFRPGTRPHRSPLLDRDYAVVLVLRIVTPGLGSLALNPWARQSETKVRMRIVSQSSRSAGRSCMQMNSRYFLPLHEPAQGFQGCSTYCLLRGDVLVGADGLIVDPCIEVGLLRSTTSI